LLSLLTEKKHDLYKKTPLNFKDMLRRTLEVKDNTIGEEWSNREKDDGSHVEENSTGRRVYERENEG